MNNKSAATATATATADPSLRSRSVIASAKEYIAKVRELNADDFGPAAEQDHLGVALLLTADSFPYPAGGHGYMDRLEWAAAIVGLFNIARQQLNTEAAGDSGNVVRLPPPPHPYDDPPDDEQ